MTTTLSSTREPEARVASRRSYTPPVLKVYGDVATMTSRVGWGGNADGGSGLRFRSMRGQCPWC
jgi:hypothetical protein